MYNHPNIILCIALFACIVVTCSEDIVRLTDLEFNDNTVRGDVSIFYDDEWRDLCARLWSTQDVQVVCNMIGFNSSIPARTDKNRLHGQIKLREYLFLYTGMACSGNENSIVECSNWKRSKIVKLRYCSEGIAVAICNRD